MSIGIVRMRPRPLPEVRPVASARFNYLEQNGLHYTKQFLMQMYKDPSGQVIQDHHAQIVERLR
jgi:hypothetical protein